LVSPPVAAVGEKEAPFTFHFCRFTLPQPALHYPIATRHHPLWLEPCGLPHLSCYAIYHSKKQTFISAEIQYGTAFIAFLQQFLLSSFLPLQVLFYINKL
jgi:hypothetical protein